MEKTEKLTFICTLVPDEASGPPHLIEASDMKSFTAAIYEAVMRYKKGWIYPVINGQRAQFSNSRQTFLLRTSDNECHEIKDDSSPVFESNGRFNVLVALS